MSEKKHEDYCGYSQGACTCAVASPQATIDQMGQEAMADGMYEKVPQATRPHDDCDCPCEKCADGGEHCGKKPCDCAVQPAAGTKPHGYQGSAVETRLTAEQFYFDGRMCKQHKRNCCDECMQHAGRAAGYAAGLREEIERLKTGDCPSCPECRARRVKQIISPLSSISDSP